MLGPRDDGFHEIETVFLALSWGDHLEVELADTEKPVQVEIAGDTDLPHGRDNLAVRAALEYREAAAAAGRPLESGVRIRLQKVVPMGAGLGGGSADAAVVLDELERSAGALGAEGLQELATRIGSDVPFFLLPQGVAVGRGRGERLEPLPRPPPFDVVLIMPVVRHATARVFEHWQAVEGVETRSGLLEAVEALASGDPGRIRAAHHNALLEPARRAYPGFEGFFDRVAERLGRPPALSGSGSTLYDVPDPGEADDVVSRLQGIPARVLRLAV